jgi:beta-lactamase superfamily II metal-dependent hydrolase
VEPAQLYILDVGHGNAAVLLDARGVLVVDAGPRTSLLEFLLGEGIRRVDVVLVSHADKDHIEGLISLIESETVEIGRVRLNTDLEKGTALWSQLIFLLDRCHREKKIDFNVALTTRNTGEYDQGSVRVEILAPSLRVAGAGVGSKASGKRLRTNTISAVIRLVEQQKPQVLLCGDIDDTGVTEMLKDFPNPEASILVFPHHGGRADVADMALFARRLCEVVKPSTVIFSIGRGLHATPIPEVIAAVRSSGGEPRIACTQLSEHCAAKNPTTAPTHLLEVYSAGRELGRCCSGTIRVVMSEGEIHPAQASHFSFIEAHAPTALCKK